MDSARLWPPPAPPPPSAFLGFFLQQYQMQIPLSLIIQGGVTYIHKLVKINLWNANLQEHL